MLSDLLGASALDLCLVASGTLDGYVDCVVDAHGVWDYAGASLVCAEAGVPIVDAHGRDLIVFDHDARRTPVAASTPELLEALLQVRRTL
jgi:myo-inositol-1(or 4)-monophosphatase